MDKELLIALFNAQEEVRVRGMMNVPTDLDKKVDQYIAYENAKERLRKANEAILKEKARNVG